MVRGFLLVLFFSFQAVASTTLCTISSDIDSNIAVLSYDMDVGMDGNNLTPYEMREVEALLKDRKVKASVLPSDHHEERLKGEQ